MLLLPISQQSTVEHLENFESGLERSRAPGNAAEPDPLDAPDQQRFHLAVLSQRQHARALDFGPAFDNQTDKINIRFGRGLKLLPFLADGLDLLEARQDLNIPCHGQYVGFPG